jgi:hypothetical protein
MLCRVDFIEEFCFEACNYSELGKAQMKTKFLILSICLYGGLTFGILSAACATDHEVTFRVTAYEDTGAACCNRINNWTVLREGEAVEACHQSYGADASPLNGTVQGVGYCTPYPNHEGGYKYKCDAPFRAICRVSKSSSPSTGMGSHSSSGNNSRSSGSDTGIHAYSETPPPPPSTHVWPPPPYHNGCAGIGPPCATQAK